VEALNFNKVKLNMKRIKLVRVIKLYRDARSTKHQSIENIFAALKLGSTDGDVVMPVVH
jgi:hypothetical protein